MAFPLKEFVLKYTLTSSDITQVSQALTVPANAGEIIVNDVIVMSDVVGLAGGTNFQVHMTQDFGQNNVFVEAVANLGGAKTTVNFDTASITGQRTVLADGEGLFYRSTAADCTGAGQIEIYVICQQATSGAQIF